MSKKIKKMKPTWSEVQKLRDLVESQRNEAELMYDAFDKACDDLDVAQQMVMRLAAMVVDLHALTPRIHNVRLVRRSCNWVDGITPGQLPLGVPDMSSCSRKEIDRSLVVLDIMDQVNSIPAMAPRAQVKGALRLMVEKEWTPEAIMATWKRTSTGVPPGYQVGVKQPSLMARCTRMLYAASLDEKVASDEAAAKNLAQYGETEDEG